MNNMTCLCQTQVHWAQDIKSRFKCRPIQSWVCVRLSRSDGGKECLLDVHH